MRPRRVADVPGPSRSPLAARMRNVLGLVPLALLAGCVTTASRLPPPEHYFDCDVPPGKFSEWSRTVSARSVQISGTVELIEPRPDARWGTVANILIRGERGGSSVGLRVYFDWRSPEVVHFLLMGQGAPSDQDILSLPWQGQATPFTVALSGSGELKVSVASVAQVLEVSNFDIHGVQLSCSTAQFKFRRVIIDEH